MSLRVVCISILILFSATQAKGLDFFESYVFKQISWIALAAAILLLIVNISYQKFIDVSYVLYAINIVLLGLVLVPLAALATALLPVRTTAHPEAIADWLGLSVVSLALTRATKLWIESHGWGASGYWMSTVWFLFNKTPSKLL